MIANKSFSPKLYLNGEDTDQWVQSVKLMMMMIVHSCFSCRLRSISQVTWKHRESVTGQWHLMADVHTTQPDWFALLERSNMFIFAKDHIPFPDIIINCTPFHLLHIDYIVPLMVKIWRSPTPCRWKQIRGLSVHITVRLYIMIIMYNLTVIFPKIFISLVIR